MIAEAEVRETMNSSQPDHPEQGEIRRSAPNESQNLSVSAVELRDVHFFFDDEKVLDGVSFSVMRGEIKY